MLYVQAFISDYNLFTYPYVCFAPEIIYNPYRYNGNAVICKHIVLLTKLYIQIIYAEMCVNLDPYRSTHKCTGERAKNTFDVLLLNTIRFIHCSVYVV